MTVILFILVVFKIIINCKVLYLYMNKLCHILKITWIICIYILRYANNAQNNHLFLQEIHISWVCGINDMYYFLSHIHETDSSTL